MWNKGWELVAISPILFSLGLTETTIVERRLEEGMRVTQTGH